MEKTGRKSSWRLMLHEKDIPAGQEQDRPPGEMFKDTYDLHQESTFEYFCDVCGRCALEVAKYLQSLPRALEREWSTWDCRSSGAGTEAAFPK